MFFNQNLDDDIADMSLRHASSEHLRAFSYALHDVALRNKMLWDGSIWHDVVGSDGTSSWEVFYEGELSYQLLFNFYPISGQRHTNNLPRVTVDSQQSISKILILVADRLASTASLSKCFTEVTHGSGVNS